MVQIHVLYQPNHHLNNSCNNLGVTPSQFNAETYAVTFNLGTNYKYQLQNGLFENAKRRSALSGHGQNVLLTVNSEKNQKWLKHHAVTNVGISVHQ